jgi:Raf kinase inhibitor-like YbhB/YbcL family protein
MKRMLGQAGVMVLAVMVLPVVIMQRGGEGSAISQGNFQISSTTFQNDTFVPISMILNFPVNGVNACSVDGSAGGDMSPEVAWSGAPAGTKSFVVTLFDSTAGFTHWGMYNIAPTTNSLPEGAGTAGSTFGPQVMNDFFFGEQYDGPCPPNETPEIHHYVLSVYALNTMLNLRGSANFPSNGEALYNGMFGHILAQASITGLYSIHP